MLDERVRLFTVTHLSKITVYPFRQCIHVGNGEFSGDMLTDNTGDNIAHKNKNYCELTAVYWIWKNVECDIVGIEHYRRVFGFSFFDIKNYFILKPNKIKKILDKYDVICPNRCKFNDTLLNRYKNNMNPDDFDYIKRIIGEKYPDYLDSFEYVMNSNIGSMYNMMICKKELFDSYCSWLFDILFESEKFIDPTIRDAYRARVFGFLSERLLNIWIHKNNLRVYYTSVVKTDKGRIRGFLGVIKSKIKYLISKEIHL